MLILNPVQEIQHLFYEGIDPETPELNSGSG